MINKHAQIAQSVEQRTENPCVTGSIPVLGIFFCLKQKLHTAKSRSLTYGKHYAKIKAVKNGLLAQAVEHLTFNQGVAGSSPA